MHGPELTDIQSLTNLLRNGGFERWVAAACPYWTLAGSGAAITEDSTDYYIGGRSIQLSRVSADATLTQNISGQTAPLAYIQGKTFTLSARIKPSVGSKAVIGLDDGVRQVWSGHATNTVDYEVVSVTLVADFNATKLEAVCKVKDTEGTAHFDACMLTEGSAIPSFAPNPLDYQDPQVGDTTAPGTPTGLVAIA